MTAPLTQAEAVDLLGRSDRELVGRDISGLDFSGMDLTGKLFNNVIARKTKFGGATLIRAGFDNAQLQEAVFDGANCESATLSDANLSLVSAKKANFKRANLHKARALNANFESATLAKASFDSAQLSRVDFVHGDLSYTSFDRAELIRVSLRGATLRGTTFRNATLRGIRGGMLDECVTSGAVWDSRGTWLGFAGPLWRQLRHDYTGTRAGFHLLLLVVFLSPFALRTAFWVTVNRGQVAMQTADSALSAVVASGPTVDVRRIPITPCLAAECRQVRVWQVIVGADKGGWAGVPAVLLLAYNLIRAMLTWKVAPLRDEEEASGHSPAKGQYRLLGWFHWAFTILLCWALTHGAYVLVGYLRTPIFIAK